MSIIDIIRVYDYVEKKDCMKIKVKSLETSKINILVIRIPVNYKETGLVNINIVENILNPIYTDYDTIDDMYNSLKNTDNSYFDFLPKYLYLYHDSEKEIIKDIRLSNKETYTYTDVNDTIYRIHLLKENISEICEVISSIYDTYQNAITYQLYKSEVKSVYISDIDDATRITIDDGNKPAHLTPNMVKGMFKRYGVGTLDKDALYMIKSIYGKSLHLRKLDYLPINTLNRDKIVTYFILESMYELMNTLTKDDFLW